MIKIDIISGFYGAGKTRFIKKIMSEGINKNEVSYLKYSTCKGEYDAFLIEKFGIKGFEINIDIENIFYKEALVSALKTVLDLYEPKRILIETAGNMSLSKVIEAVKNVSKPGMISMNAVVTIVDTKRVIENIENFPCIFREQVENAQTIVLNDTDKVNKEELYACEVALRKFNSHATVFVTPWAEVEGTNMRNSIEVTSQLESIVRKITSKEKLPLVYDRKKTNEKKILEEQNKIKGMILHTEKIFEEGQVKKIIDSILELNKDIIRLKGNLLTANNESIRVDYLQEKLFIWNDKKRGTGNIQFIGKNLVQEQIEENF